MELSYEKFRDEEEKLQYFFSVKQCDSIFATHFHESLEIVFLTNGRTEATVNGKTYTALSGDALFINRFDLHSYKSCEGNETHVFILGRKLTEPFFTQANAGFPALLDDKNANAEILSAVKSLTPYSGGNVIDSGIACTLLGLIGRFYPRSAPSDKTEAHLIRRIVSYISEHYRDDVTLNSLSADFGYSANYFSKLFNEYLGMHLRDYLNSVRVYYAKRMLENGTAATVTEAYMKCGFDSQSTFYRAYKRAYGKNPGKNS